MAKENENCAIIRLEFNKRAFSLLTPLDSFCVEYPKMEINFKLIAVSNVVLLTLTISGVILTFFFLWHLAKRSILVKQHRRKIKLGKQFKGPPYCLPILGHSLNYVGKSPEQIFNVLLEMRQYGDFSVIWIFDELNLLVNDVDAIEEILVNSKFIDKADEYRVLQSWLREGLLTSTGSKWFKRRKIITPAFHFKILEQFINIFDKQSNILIESLSKYKPNEAVELYDSVTLCALDVICGTKWFNRRKIITPAFHFTILQQFIHIFDSQGNILINKLKQFKQNDDVVLYNLVTLCALDVICEAAMGVSANAQKDSDSEYVNAVRTISTVLHKRMFDIIYRYDFLFNLTPLARQQKKALSILHKFSERVIVSRRQELILKSKQAENDNVNDFGEKKRMAFLDILLQSDCDGKPLTNSDIREEVDTFMFEGHDTTTSAITFCLYNLATNPEAQDKCFQEILSIFGNDKEIPATYDDLCNLRYMELVAKETLRMYPSVPILGRKIKEECEINGKIIPAGTNIGICPMALGRDPRIFPEPNKFIPERFDAITTGGGADKLHPFAFIPFSAGPRNCIGQKFAMLEIKSVVSKILRNFEISYVGYEEPILIAELILKCKNNLKFNLKPRIYP